MPLWELNRCACCDCQLPLDDFDGLCSECDTEEHDAETEKAGYCKFRKRRHL